MATEGLFTTIGFETPEQVRGRIGKAIEEDFAKQQGLLQQSISTGGPVQQVTAAAQQAGGLIGKAFAGEPAPSATQEADLKKAEKFSAALSSTESAMTAAGATFSQNSAASLSVFASELEKQGLVQEALQVKNRSREITGSELDIAIKAKALQKTDKKILTTGQKTLQLRDEVRQAVVEGDLNGARLLTAKLQEETGTTTPAPYVSQLRKQRFKADNAITSLNAALNFMTRSDEVGAVDRIKRVGRGLLAQATSISPALRDRFSKALSNPRQNVRQTALESAVLAVASTLQGDRGGITKQNIEAASELLGAKELATSPERIADKLRTVIAQQSERRGRIESELSKDVKQLQAEITQGVEASFSRTSPATPTSKAEFDALPKGAHFINPSDGTLRKK